MPGSPSLSNRLLGAIPDSVRAQMLAAGRTVRHDSGHRIHSIGETVQNYWFPLSGMVSLTVDTDEGQTVEVAVTGREGFVGVGRYLGEPNAETNAVVQVSGEFLRVPTSTVTDAAAADPEFRRAIDQYVRSLMVELAQSAVCNQVHSVEQRTARWLLHASDRAATTDLRLTQEFLAQMLAVRRSSVTAVVGIFTRAHLIDAQRGLITIADREGLRALTCECYEVVLAATPTYDGLAPTV